MPFWSIAPDFPTQAWQIPVIPFIDRKKQRFYTLPPVLRSPYIHDLCRHRLSV